MAIQEQLVPVAAALGIGTGVGAALDVVSVGLAIAVAVLSLVALVYNIVLKRKQIKWIDGKETGHEEEDD